MKKLMWILILGSSAWFFPGNTNILVQYDVIM